jgi:hypothetical protein
MGSEGKPPNDIGHHHHDDHDGTGHFARPTMLLGPLWSLSGTINNMDGGLSISKTASGMTITSGVLDEHGKCIVPRSSHHDGGDSSSAYPRPALLTSEQADQMQYDAMLGPGPAGGQIGQAQMPMTQNTNGHELEYDSSRTGQVLNVLQEYLPRYLGARVNEMWDVLKGKGQKGGGGRDAWIIFAKPDLSQQPVQIEHPQQVVENSNGHARHSESATHGTTADVLAKCAA